MASGRPLTSGARGWREGQPEEAGISCLTGRIPASFSQCMMSQRQHQELLWESTFTKDNLIPTCTPSASIFIRSRTPLVVYQFWLLLHHCGVSERSWVLMHYCYLTIFWFIFFSISSWRQMITHLIIWHKLLSHIQWSGKCIVLIIPLDRVCRPKVKCQFSVTRTLWPVASLTATHRMSAWPVDFLPGRTLLCHPRINLTAPQSSPSALLSEYTGQLHSFVSAVDVRLLD